MPDTIDFFPPSPNTGAIDAGAGIGTEFMIGGSPFDWQQTIISQYANSPRLMNWCANFAASLDQGQNLDDFYDFLWNIQTCLSYGLDVWGRIVVINRTLQVSTRFFGFEEGLPDYDPFNVSPFYTGGATTAAFVLGDDAYRLLILAKAAANISYGSIQGLNQILQLLFPNRGPCYVIDNEDMTMVYHFGFVPSPVELAIIETSNVLPRPTGVKVSVEVVP